MPMPILLLRSMTMIIIMKATQPPLLIGVVTVLFVMTTMTVRFLFFLPLVNRHSN
jgi:hypothetical protein